MPSEQSRALLDRLKLAAQTALQRQDPAKPAHRALVAITGEELRQLTALAGASSVEPKPACLAVQTSSAAQVGPEDNCAILAEDALVMIELAAA